jgi:hypothetical protein
MILSEILEINKPIPGISFVNNHVTRAVATIVFILSIFLK